MAVTDEQWAEARERVAAFNSPEWWAQVRAERLADDPASHISEAAHEKLVAGTLGPACGSCGTPHEGMTCEERKALLPKRHPGGGGMEHRRDRWGFDEDGEQRSEEERDVLRSAHEMRARA